MSDPVSGDGRTPPVLPATTGVDDAHAGESAVLTKTAAWEDVLDIFYAPRAVFERRRDGKYLVPVIVLCLTTAVVFFLSRQLNDVLQDVEFARVIRQNGMTAEQAAAGRAMTKKVGELGIYLVPIFVAIGVWVTGTLIQILGRAMGAKLNFAQGCTIAALSSLPELLGKVLVGTQAVFLDTASVAHRHSFSISVARFLPGDVSNWLLKFAAMIDPFVLWGACLLGLGAYVIGGMEKEKAAVLAIILTLLTTVIAR